MTLHFYERVPALFHRRNSSSSHEKSKNKKKDSSAIEEMVEEQQRKMSTEAEEVVSPVAQSIDEKKFSTVSTISSTAPSNNKKKASTVSNSSMASTASELLKKETKEKAPVALVAGVILLWFMLLVVGISSTAAAPLEFAAGDEPGAAEAMKKRQIYSGTVIGAPVLPVAGVSVGLGAVPIGKREVGPHLDGTRTHHAERPLHGSIMKRKRTIGLYSGTVVGPAAPVAPVGGVVGVGTAPAVAGVGVGVGAPIGKRSTGEGEKRHAGGIPYGGERKSIPIAVPPELLSEANVGKRAAAYGGSVHGALGPVGGQQIQSIGKRQLMGSMSGSDGTAMGTIALG